MLSRCDGQWLHFEVGRPKPRVTGRGAQAGADAGRWRGIGWASHGGPIREGPLPLVRLCIQPDLANQRTERPPNFLPSPTGTAATCWRASLTGRTAQALFSPNPAHHANAACAWTDAQQARGNFHTWRTPSRPMSDPMRPAPVPTRPPTRCRLDRAGLAYAISVSQQPLYTQSGPLTRSAVPPAVRHLP